MELAELTAYAEAIYHIREERRSADEPGFSALRDPRSGKIVALLMRQWDPETGELMERCDLRCGQLSVPPGLVPWIDASLRMRGPDWIGLRFDDRTDPEVVFRLLDRAMDLGTQHGATVILENRHTEGPAVHRDTPLPFAAGLRPKLREEVPELLRQMRRLYQYGSGSGEEIARNFLRQGTFMESYEDDLPWEGEFTCFFPTYHDLNTRQLRGYFTWRAAVRRGVFEPVPASVVYIYLYELLNGIGAGSTEEIFRQLAAFEAGYLDAGFGNSRMQANLRRWQLDLAVLKDLPQQTARQFADPEILGFDEALAALKKPREHTDAAVFAALCRFGGKKTAQSPVLTGDPDRGMHLFAEAWRIACANFRENGRSLFPLCFGERQTRRWYPMENAVYCMDERPENRDYSLNPCRTYSCRDGVWQVRAYQKTHFDMDRFRSFLHETELQLRRYLKTGRYLRERPDGGWVRPFVTAAITDDRCAAEKAARPKIEIDLSGLAKIRTDALATRDSLLIDEEEDLLAPPAPADSEAAPAFSAEPAAFVSAPKLSAGSAPDAASAPGPEPTAASNPGTAAIAGPGTPPVSVPVYVPEPKPLSGPGIVPAPEQACGPKAGSPDLPLDAVQTEILRILLRGGSPAELLSARHIMPSLAADAINEALYDEIGDTVLLCEDDVLSLVEDYAEDINELLGG